MAKQVKTLRLNDKVALESDVDSRLHQSSAAPVFDDTQDYPADYHVTYNGYLYRFTSAHAAGAWTGNDVVAENMTTPDAMLDLTSAGFLRVVSADGTILWMQNALSASRNEIAANFSASTAYAPPTLVVYNGVLYRCSTAHPAGAWNATHFTAATVQDVLAILKSSIDDNASDISDLGDILDGKADNQDVVLTAVYDEPAEFTEWTCSPSDITDPGGGALTINSITYDSGYWVLNTTPYGNIDATQGNPDDTTVVFSGLGYKQQVVTATRTRLGNMGYQLGEQSDKLLQPKGDYAEKVVDGFEDGILEAALGDAWADKTSDTVPNLIRGIIAALAELKQTSPFMVDSDGNVFVDESYVDELGEVPVEGEENEDGTLTVQAKEI